MKDIAIVIPCFNRTDTLQSLLNSLLKAKYDREVELIFSIDYSGSDEVSEVAEKFCWPFGRKKLVKHEKNIGLRQNIISCGDMTNEHDAVIVLEDDLIVSPSFFDYASKACDYYWDSERVGGISLYSYRYNENFEKREFIPITGGYDTFFIQFTSSWGQLWTKRQWADFKKWYIKQSEDLTSFPIPSFVKKWKASWKKYNIAYLTETNRYYVYPVQSFTTITPACGVHSYEANLDNLFIVPLANEILHDYVFQDFDGALKYDCFFEVKEWSLVVDGKQIEIDFNIYCSKSPRDLMHGYYVTLKKQQNKEPLATWGRRLLPIEMNIINNSQGGDIYLYRKDKRPIVALSLEEKFKLHFVMAGRDLLRLAVMRVISGLIIKLSR